MPNCSPYTCVVNKVVLGLRNDLDVIKSRLGSRARTDFHTEPPLPHGSFLWWVRYTWGCQTGIGGPILSVSSYKKKNLRTFWTSRRNIIFTNPTYTLLFSHYQPQNKRWANISFWVTCCAQREMTGRRKATKSTHVIIIFIILVGGMTEASESSISFSAQQGFKLDILDRNSYIMSHVYIKHGFTWSNKTLNYNIAKQNIISFLHSGKRKHCHAFLYCICASLIYFPCNTRKCSVNAMIIKIINKLSSLPTPKYYYISKAWILRGEIHSTQKALKHWGMHFINIR